MDGTPTTPPATTTQPPNPGLQQETDEAQQWANAAPPAGPSQADMSKMQGPAPATLPTAPQQAVQPRGGLVGVVDQMMDILAGTTKPVMGTDANGNPEVQQRGMTRGQQVGRVIGEGLKGAAAGFAAGRGAGNMGNAAFAGVQQGEQDQQKRDQQPQQMTQQARETMLANANYQMLRMNLAESQWKLTSMQQQASEQQVKFAQDQEDRLTKEGGTVIGRAAHEADLGDILKVQPDVMEQMIVHHRLELVPDYDASGKAAGVKAILMPNDYRNRLAAPGSEFKTFDPASGELLTHKTADPTTQGFVDDLNAKAMNDQHSFQLQKADIEQKAQLAAEEKANASKAPSEIIKNNADAAKANSEARKARIEADSEDAGGAAGSTPQQNAQMMVDGLSSPGLLSKRNKEYNQMLPLANAYSQQKYGVPFDAEVSEGRYQARKKAITQYADGPPADQIQSFQTYLGHSLNLSNVIDQLRNTNSPLLNVPLKSLRKAMGDTRYAEIDPLIQAVKREQQNFLNNNKALHMQDIDEGQTMLNDTMTLGQAEAAMKSLGSTAITRMGTLNNRYQRAVGSGNIPQLIDPVSRQAIQKMGLEGQAQTELGGSYAQQPPQPRPGGGQAPGGFSVPAGARPGYQNGKLVGYQDATGWHPAPGVQ